jgi:hypothetical protein
MLGQLCCRIRSSVTEHRKEIPVVSHVGIVRCSLLYTQLTELDHNRHFVGWVKCITYGTG